MDSLKVFRIFCVFAILAIFALPAGAEKRLRLHAYPNPFVAGYTDAHIAYTLPSAGTVSLYIYNREGTLVRTVGEGLRRGAGYHEREDSWNGRDDDGEFVPPGLYVIVLEARIAGEVFREPFVVVVRR